MKSTYNDNHRGLQIAILCPTEQLEVKLSNNPSKETVKEIEKGKEPLEE